MSTGSPRLWGVMAEFDTAEALLHAAQAAREAGYQRIEAYTPFPVEGLSEAIGFRGDRVAPVTFLGGLLGGVAGYFLQWYSAVVDYPINVGGRPLNSWPMFVPITFEMTILGAALAAFGAAIIGNRLPDLWTPAAEVPGFELAERNRFFLALRADDAQFDAGVARAWLEQRQPLRCTEVPAA